jgi:hypothetical protein
VIGLDGATVLLQWSVGGLAFLWVTTRRRQVGLGYGWLLRGLYAVLALGAALVGLVFDPVPVRDGAALAVAAVAGTVLAVSVALRRAGVRGQVAEHDRRSERVAAMTGIERHAPSGPAQGAEFDPRLDLIAPAVGLIGLVAGGVAAGGPAGLAVARTVVGAAFLGSVFDAMLLGHWYLVQPGLPRAPLLELVRWVGWIWPAEVGLLLVPTGMVSVLVGTVDDGYGGLLGWFWVASAVTTIILVYVTRAALRERSYSAVMAATGLLYLAILTAFCTDLVARAVLAG